MNRGVIDDPPRSPIISSMWRRLSGCRVPAHADQHHLQRTVQPLEHLAQRLNHPRHPVVSFGSNYQRRLVATEPASRLGPHRHAKFTAFATAWSSP